MRANDVVCTRNMLFERQMIVIATNLISVLFFFFCTLYKVETISDIMFHIHLTEFSISV